MIVERTDQRKQQAFAPVLDAGPTLQAGEALNDCGGVFVDRGQEQRFLVGEVGVGHRATHPGVGDVRDRRGPESISAKSFDGGTQDGLVVLLAYGGGPRFGAGSHGDKGNRTEGLRESLSCSKVPVWPRRRPRCRRATLSHHPDPPDLLRPVDRDDAEALRP